MDQPHATTRRLDDLSALAWVHDELRRSLEAAHKSLRRYLKEAEALAGSDVDAVDPAVLRHARPQMHQGVGALELVGLPAAATLLRASEARGAAAGRAAATHRRRRPSRPSSAARSRCSTTSRACWPASRSRRWRCSRSTGRCRSWPAPTACTRPTCGRVDWQWRELPATRGAAPRAADAGTRAATRGADAGADARPQAPARPRA